MKLHHYILFIFLIGSGIYYYSHRPITRPNGVLVSQSPNQGLIDLNLKPIVFKKDIIQPLASYEITARVLSKKRYRFDKQSKYSPWDFALGWGQMSDTDILKEMKVTQSGRFYFVNWDKPLSISTESIFEQSSNTHLIPANSFVSSVLSEIRIGHVVKFKGYLARIDMKSGAEWKSSLVRNDMGNGACELLYIQHAQILE